MARITRLTHGLTEGTAAPARTGSHLSKAPPTSRPRASGASRAWVCRDCVLPRAAAIASRPVRVTLLTTSWAVRLHPLVWQWVRRLRDRGSFGLKGWMSLAHNARAARSFAISMKKFMPIAQKKESRVAEWTMSSPAATPGVGEASEVKGFYFATCFSGHGFALGPGAGLLMSELILDGKTSIDIRPFRPSRFREGDMADWTRTI